jgi:phosphotransferase system  glucose/maltose/N-acetylglucosamine-specific IIC component
MTLVIELVVAVVGGFVFGVLFGRKNVKTVEAELAKVKDLAAKAGVKL